MGAHDTRVAENLIHLLLKIGKPNFTKKRRQIRDPRDGSKIVLTETETKRWNENKRKIHLDMLMSVGTIELCVDLCSHGVSRSLQESAVELAIVILQGIEDNAARDRIAEALQDKERSYYFFQGIYYMISDSKSMFRQLRNLIELERDLPAGGSENKESKKVDLGLGSLSDDDPWSFKVLDFLRLALDGHHSKMQALLREQPRNNGSLFSSGTLPRSRTCGLDEACTILPSLLLFRCSLPILYLVSLWITLPS